MDNVSLSNSNILSNPNITKPFVQAKPSSGVGKVSGMIAQAWLDNSSWAQVRVIYAEESRNNRSDHSCQRIDVQQVLDDGKVHFYQQLTSITVGQRYQAQVWLRESVAVPIEVTVRQLDAPYRDIAYTTITPGNKWQQAELSWHVNNTDRLGLYIRVAEPVTLWVADASVQQIAPLPASEGNLLVNGSFETGLAAGWIVWNSSTRFADQPISVDRTTAYTGNASLKIRILPTLERMTVIELTSPPVEIPQADTYTASVALKSQYGPITVSVSLQGSKVAQSFTVDNQWQRVSITGVLLPGQTAFVVRSVNPADKENTILVDAAELSRRSQPTPAYEPAYPVELNLTTTQPAHVFHGSQAMVLNYAAVGLIPADAKLHLTISDLYDHREALPPLPLTSSNITLPRNITHRYGMYRATAVVFDASGQPISSEVDLCFARLPKPRNIDPTQSFFGVHMPLTAPYFPIARALGIRWVRLHDASLLTKWTVAQPTPSPIRFFDAPITQCRKAGLAILGMLDGAPAWSTSKPNPTTDYMAHFYNNPDTPAGKQAWQAYVKAMVGHYKGRIDFWEVWNEPWNLADRFFPGTAEQYGNLLKLTCATAKRANRSATIVGIDTYRPIESVSPDFTKLAIKAAGISSFDVFSYHDYSPDTVADSQNNVQLKQAREFRQILKPFEGPSPKPMWTTEGGVSHGLRSMYLRGQDGATLLADQARMVRFLVGLMAAGSQRFFLYTFFLHPKGYGSTDSLALEHDRALRPALAAWAVLASMVDGAGTPVTDDSIPGVSIFRFAASQGLQVTVYWSHDGKPHHIPYPKDAALLDIQGNPIDNKSKYELGPIPVYAVRRV